jgi:hypothetical protein
VTQDFGWLNHSSPRPEPLHEYICSFWTLRGSSGRNVTCSAYRTDVGLELRAEYGPEELVASELFRGVDADERLAQKADLLRHRLLAKGFHEIAK